MPDRESIIKGWDEVLSRDPMDVPWDLIDDTRTLLKEQEPKAIEYHDNPYTGLPVAHCPNCKRYARQFHSSVEEETHYCPWCGQAVKWNA